MKKKNLSDTSKTDSLEDIYLFLDKFRKERAWERFHTPMQLALSLVLESSEVLEVFQWKTEKQSQAFLKSQEGKDKIGEELADVLSYLLLLSNAVGIDLIDTWKKKMIVNEKKYPIEQAKGNAKKYTELGNR